MKDLMLGELTHKAELMEMDFLRSMGIDPIYKYSEVEDHIGKIFGTFSDKCEKSYEDKYEGLEDDLEDKIDAIESASASLADMKKFVSAMRKSILKERLISCIEDMELALC